MAVFDVPDSFILEHISVPDEHAVVGQWLCYRVRNHVVGQSNVIYDDEAVVPGISVNAFDQLFTIDLRNEGAGEDDIGLGCYWILNDPATWAVADEHRALAAQGVER